MNQWMAKVNEMKQLRQQGAPTTTATPRQYATVGAGSTPSNLAWRGNSKANISATSSPPSFPPSLSLSSSGSLPPKGTSTATASLSAPPASLSTAATNALASKSGDELARELALLRRQLEEADKDAGSAKRELEDVKVKREEARKRLRLKQQQQIQSLKMNSMQRQIGQKQQSMLASPPPGQSRTPSSRQSTRASARVSGGKVVSHIARVIQEMARLEATVTSAEEAQARAESELLEYAAERRKTEEALIAMQQQLEKVADTLSSAIEEMRSDVQLAELLTEVKVGLHGCHMILTCKTLTTATEGSTSSPQAEKLARRRGMTFGVTPAMPSAPAPPPAPAPFGGVPPPPPPAEVSLLSAIREGKQNADLQALRQKRASMRKSVVVVQSLTDTLREAMKMRNEVMTGDEDEDDEDEYDWLG